MLKSISIENYRGIRSLTVKDLGRVTLIVGKNESGKTALAEAIAVGEALPNAFSVLGTMQARRDSTLPIVDFDEFWRPLFWRGDAEQSMSFTWEREGNSRPRHASLQVTRDRAPLVVTDASGPAGAAWSLAMSGTIGDEPVTARVLRTNQGLQLPPYIPSSSSGLGVWVGALSGDASSVKTSVQTFSRAIQAGRKAAMLEMARMVDERIADVEVLAPAGVTKLYVKMNDSTYALPSTMMGDGFQKCLDIASAFGRAGEVATFVDEMENGLHHSLLVGLWRWIAKFTEENSLQCFATTHSEECVQEVSKAFRERNDDGLRVVRLDRVGDETRATVYDSKLIEAAERMDIDVRG